MKIEIDGLFRTVYNAISIITITILMKGFMALKFKFWMRLFALQIVLVPLGKIWIQLFSLLAVGK